MIAFMVGRLLVPIVCLSVCLFVLNYNCDKIKSWYEDPLIGDHELRTKRNHNFLSIALIFSCILQEDVEAIETKDYKYSRHE